MYIYIYIPTPKVGDGALTKRESGAVGQIKERIRTTKNPGSREFGDFPESGVNPLHGKTESMLGWNPRVSGFVLCEVGAAASP